MTDATQQAIDYFAGELPPGAFSHNGDLYWGDRDVGHPCAAWDHFTTETIITRRAWAESQCLAKVRELAAAKFDELVEVEIRFGVAGPYDQRTVNIRVIGHAPHFVFGRPDLLTAAHAACLALEAE